MPLVDVTARRGAVKYVGQDYGIIIHSGREYLFTMNESLRNVTVGENVTFRPVDSEVQRAENIVVLDDQDTMVDGPWTDRGRMSSASSGPTIIDLLQVPRQNPAEVHFYIGDGDEDDCLSPTSPFV